MAMTSNPSSVIALVMALFALAHVSDVVASKDSKLEYLVPMNKARSVENLAPLVWNNTLASFAKTYANQRAGDCELIHSEDERYGEDLAMSPGEMSATDAVKMWVDEKSSYDYGSNTCAEGKMCGHYTQVVWKATTSIGCAKVKCANGGTFITCNFYPPGNYIGEKPF